MARVRAAVLAAGRGVRMGGEQPKTLLPLNDKEPMLHYILSGLRSAGIEDIMLVTGFRPDVISEWVGQHLPDLSPTYVRNARFASWGNFHSVRVALDQSPGYDLLVVNSDVIVPPDVYSRVANAHGDLVLAVQKKLVLDQEDMRVRLQGDRVLGVSKNMKRAYSHGEYAGVSLLRHPAALAYQDEANRREWAGDTDGYYEDVYDSIAGLVESRAVRVGEDEYAEVDTPHDVSTATQVVDRHADAWRAPAATG